MTRARYQPKRIFLVWRQTMWQSIYLSIYPPIISFYTFIIQSFPHNEATNDLTCNVVISTRFSLCEQLWVLTYLMPDLRYSKYWAISTLHCLPTWSRLIRACEWALDSIFEEANTAALKMEFSNLQTLFSEELRKRNYQSVEFLISHTSTVVSLERQSAGCPRGQNWNTNEIEAISHHNNRDDYKLVEYNKTYLNSCINN